MDSQLAASMYFNPRYCRDKPSVPFFNVLKLFPHFITQIPGKNKDPVGPMSAKMGFIDNRNPAAGHKFSLFSGVAICHVTQQIGSDPGIIEQCVAFCRGAIGSDG